MIDVFSLVIDVFSLVIDVFSLVIDVFSLVIDAFSLVIDVFVINFLRIFARDFFLMRKFPWENPPLENWT